MISNRLIFVTEVTFVLFIAYSVFTHTFLPYSYYFSALVIGLLIATFLFKSEKVNVKYTLLSLFLLFFILRSIYYLGTQTPIAYGDAYWDYAVVKTFDVSNHVFLVRNTVLPIESAGISQLTWYSGWPVLHSFCLSFSKITSINPFYLNLILSPIIAFITFLFTFLIMENFRIDFNLNRRVTYMAIILYAVLPEAIFYQIQLTRQSLALLLFTAVIYLMYKFFVKKPDRKYSLLLIVLIFSLILTHHFTSAFAIVILASFSIITIISPTFSKLSYIGSLFDSKLSNKSCLALTIASCVLLFLWWEYWGIAVWPTIQSRLAGMFGSVSTIRGVLWSSGSYPDMLKPLWALNLNITRAVLIYIPIIIGFFILLRKKIFLQSKYFLIYFSLIVGVFFLFNNFLFALEPRRPLMIAFPLLIFLSGYFYDQVFLKLRTQKHPFGKIFAKSVYALLVVVIIFSSFIGLWGYNFAPMHLYNDNIDSSQIGEVTPYYTRLQTFFSQYVELQAANRLWTDSMDSLVYVLNPSDFEKIVPIPIENVNHQFDRNDLIVSTRGLNLYKYYAANWQSVQNMSQGKIVSAELTQYFSSNANRIYDDGENIVWAPNLLP